MKKRVLSGVKPSGNLHLGNYIGALSQWVQHQDEFENFFCVVDLHAITVPIESDVLRNNIRSIAAWYLAAGIDSKKSVIFIQSQNKDHAQLGWILNCYTSVGQLNRMTQYKDKKQKVDFVSVGLFDYPVLMAADILLYNADFVPVGDDQKQHVELTRDIVERFNGKHGPIFSLPAYMPPPTGERVMSLQNPLSKMSKSESDPMGTIDMHDEPDVIRKKLKVAVTDSGNEVRIRKDKPAISNLAKIYIALSGRTAEDLDREYSGKGYKKFKEDLAEVIITALSPIREKYQNIKESKKLDHILQDGLVRAQQVSSKVLKKVEQAVGLG